MSTFSQLLKYYIPQMILTLIIIFPVTAVYFSMNQITEYFLIFEVSH